MPSDDDAAMPITHANSPASPQMPRSRHWGKAWETVRTGLKSLPWRSLAINTLGAVVWVISSAAMLVLGVFIFGSHR